MKRKDHLLAAEIFREYRNESEGNPLRVEAFDAWIEVAKKEGEVRVNDRELSKIPIGQRPKDLFGGPRMTKSEASQVSKLLQTGRLEGGSGMRFDIAHVYMTLDEGEPTVASSVHTDVDLDDLATSIVQELTSPGGASGTTVSMTVTLSEGGKVQM